MECSSLTDCDFALINSTWLHLTDDNFQCSKVESLYRSRSDAELQIKLRRLQKGCGLLSDSPKVVVGNVGFHSCVCHENFQHPYMGYFLQLTDNYEKGNLPFEGGVFDQPAQLMEIISLVQSLKNERDLAAQEKAAKQSKKKGRYE